MSQREVRSDGPRRTAIDLGNSHLQADLLLSGDVEHVDDLPVRLRLQDVVLGVHRAVIGLCERQKSAAKRIDVDDRVVRLLLVLIWHLQILRAAGRVCSHDLQDVRGILDVLRLTTNQQAVADQRQMHDAVGKVAVDLRFQSLIRFFQPLLFLGIGHDADQVAEHFLMLRIRSIREPEVEDRRAGRLPDHRDFPFRDERVIGNLFIGDLNARRRLLENEERRSAQHEVQRVLGVDPTVDETLKLGFGRRRGLRRSPHS